MHDFLINHSFGIIKTWQQANAFLLVTAIAAIILSIMIVLSNIGPGVEETSIEAIGTTSYDEPIQ